jgi:HK97 family phage major capsid protein
MSTTVTTPHVQGVTVKDIIKTDRPDADIFAAAGVGITTGVTGNKIQWAYAGGVEAAFANELAQTTERTVDISSQTPVQQRLTVRVRVSQQSLENASFDLRGLFVQAVSDAIRQKVNWAAVSTTKATSVFYGGFAQDAEKGTFGSSGYTPGKQVGTYTTLSKEVFAEMIGKLAARNIKLDKAVFVLGAEDYWKAKVTPMDEGSGIMLLGNDGRILGIPVVANNAINRATEKGAVAGHNIGLGDFSALPVMQHGNIRLSIDGVSAFAADTDEVIITINADFSMTVLKALADGFVVYSQGA